jgi:hypothetical protein
MYLGDYVKGTTVFVPFNTAGASGGSITIATNGTAKAFINGSTTALTAGVTFVEDHGGIVGRHGITVDTTGAPFTTGSDVDVALDASTIDGQVINAWVGKFSVARTSSVAAQVWAILTSTLTTAGTIGRLLVDNINATISSRMATFTYTAPDTAAATAAAVRTNLTTELGRLDVATSSRLATAGYTAPDTAVATAAAVRTNLTTELGRIDVATSTRLATAGYTAPSTADITAIKAKTDSLTFTVAGNLDSNIQRINDVTITGNGSTNPFSV